TNTQQLGNITGDKVNYTGSGLGGWTITLTNKTIGTPAYSNVTDPAGVFAFQNVPWGLYWLNETPQAGWGQSPLTPNRTVEINGTSLFITTQYFNNTQQLGNLSGYKVDGNGTGLIGWNITISNSTIPYFNSTLTNSSGGFNFTSIPWGIYQLNETPQPGWTQVTANQTVEINGTSLTLVNQNFTNTQQLGNVSGFKVNGTGNGLSGWTINLTNLTVGTPAYNTTTAGDGSFGFTNIPWGKYWLNETNQAGWIQASSTPNRTIEINGTSLLIINQYFNNTQQTGSITGYKNNSVNGAGLAGWNITVSNSTTKFLAWNVTNSSGGYNITGIPYGTYWLNETPQAGWTQSASTPNRTVTINGNSLVLFYNFTNTRLGSITGYKNNSVNGAGLAGWNITLSNSTTKFLAWNVTNSSGGYNITGIPYGTYWLNETPQAGWTQSASTPNKTVTINGNSLVLFYNFTNTQLGNISGIKYNDLNGNGVRDINDVPIPGVTIKLYYQNGTLFGTRVTDGNGSYVFSPVPFGGYILNETVPSGYRQTQPSAGNYTLLVTSTNFTFTMLFGNQQIPNPCACPTNAYFTWSVVPSKAHTIQFTDGTSGNPVYWYYDFGNGKFSLSRNPVNTYASAGTYTVKLSAKGCDCSGNTYWTYYSTQVKVP
ncbi:MAG TPA: SdrD B-like domain-containing protein, partial [Methanoregulaceae archaeon]|nr:SdrD B-like domain-containing protein [Methanoregulaceae archaeon]